jgi:murein DD-endopeptidase MepM/ murein hydrolase activator NlpD
MPQYYQHVDRRDPEASLQAAAQSMRHYLAANGGDVRKALASYNAGLGTVQSLVTAHGANWERGLPAETKQYLANILGGAAPSIEVSGGAARPFGGRGPHGVLTAPVAGPPRPGERGALAWAGEAGSSVLAPADGVVAGVEELAGALGVRLDHGNGWSTLLSGLGTSSVRRGDLVQRGQVLGSLASTEAGVRLALALRGREVDPRPYLLDTP